jgi:hypothetical protein
MNNDTEILGCFVSYPSVKYDADQKTKDLVKAQGDLFRSYIWGENGIGNSLKILKHKNYGNELMLILFQFYVKPMPIELQNLKEIENYRKNEKSIGIPIIVTNENFFSKSEEGRYTFLKQSILKKLDLLTEVVKKKKLDTNMELLKADVIKIF